MNEFDVNKFIFNKFKEDFISSSIVIHDLVVDFSNEQSEKRAKFIEIFQLFSNTPLPYSGGAEADIQGLCQSYLLGYQRSDARKFKNNLINRFRKIVNANDKSSFFEMIQSIYRASIQNSNFAYKSIENEYIFEMYAQNEEIDETEIEEEDDKISSSLQTWAEELAPANDFIKSGNHWHKKIKKTNQQQHIQLCFVV